MSANSSFKQLKSSANFNRMAPLLALALVSGSTATAGGLLDDLGYRSKFCSKLLQSSEPKAIVRRAGDCKDIKVFDEECASKCNPILKEVEEEDLDRRKASTYSNAKDKGYESARYKRRDYPDVYCLDPYFAPSGTKEACMKGYAEGRKAREDEEAEQRAAQEEANKITAARENQRAMFESGLANYYISPEYKKLRSAIGILSFQARIELSQNAQERQKSIAKQSGYIDKAAMHQLGSIIVDAKNGVSSNFTEYRSLGGSARSVTELREKINTCSVPKSAFQAFFIMAEMGIQATPQQDQIDDWIRAGRCI